MWLSPMTAGPSICGLSSSASNDRAVSGDAWFLGHTAPMNCEDVLPVKYETSERGCGCTAGRLNDGIVRGVGVGLLDSPENSVVPIFCLRLLLGVLCDVFRRFSAGKEHSVPWARHVMHADELASIVQRDFRRRQATHAGLT